MARHVSLRPKVTKEKGRGLVPAGVDSHLDREYTEYLDALDLENNSSLRQALAASTDMRFKSFFAQLVRPSKRVKRAPVTYAAKLCGIDLAEMMDWVGKAQNARTLALAQGASPRIVEHMSQDAESRMIGCDRCDGIGWVAAEEGLDGKDAPPGYRLLRVVQTTVRDADGTSRLEETPVWIRTCPAGCDHGKVRAPGDEFSRATVLEVAGHTGKRGPGVQIVQNFSGQAMPSAVNRLASAMTIDVD